MAHFTFKYHFFMEILFYNNLQISKVKKQFDKTINFLKDGDFKSADVKKMNQNGYYRAKLDDTNRLLFSFGRFNDTLYLLVLEVILNHEYEKSRFLNGAKIDESKLIFVPNEKKIEEIDVLPIGYVNKNNKKFHLLDKILSFDDIQNDIISFSTPCIIIGSAGSGKTALTLEKLKDLSGKILYTTLSPYLSENAALLYNSFDYENSHQEVSFLSFYEYVSTIEIPAGKEVDFRAFNNWIAGYKQAFKIKDSNKIYEEFKGVLTGSIIDKPYLSLTDYMSLGIKQSIFPEDEREKLYTLFEKYIIWLNDSNLFDSNIVSYNLLEKVEQDYDFVVIDEVQDITNIQLSLLLKSLKNPENFLLCGDSNQIVHPNFFSWAQVKSLFYKQDIQKGIIKVLATNYRNTPEVTKIANQLLLVKNARFGSIDKESSYLITSNSKHEGIVEFLENSTAVRTDLNTKTKNSIKFAILVLRTEDKSEAQRYFQSPLVFSIQEAKGLEYENIILYDMISSNESAFREIANGVSKEDITESAFNFSRSKDKKDKSLDEYKFYINSLYVGITRAVKNLYIIETNKKHHLLSLLDLTNFQQKSALKEQLSTKEDWQKEASKLEKQGKNEQAEAIRTQILKTEKVPWEVIDHTNLAALSLLALNPESFNKKSKDKLFEFSLSYSDFYSIIRLQDLNYSAAKKLKVSDITLTLIRKNIEYSQDNLKLVLQKTQKYGLDYRNEANFTPLMSSIYFGAKTCSKYLIENGAHLNIVDSYGRTPIQMALFTKFLYPTKSTLEFLYPLLKNESLKLKIENKLVKIDNHQAEYVIFNFFMSILTFQIREGAINSGTFHFENSDVFTFFEGLSNHIVPKFRKKKAYISSILAKNERNKEDKYNKKLFLRIQNGLYILNPKIEINVANSWVKLYDLVNINLLYDSMDTAKSHVKQNFKHTFLEVLSENEALKKEIKN